MDALRKSFKSYGSFKSSSEDAPDEHGTVIVKIDMNDSPSFESPSLANSDDRTTQTQNQAYETQAYDDKRKASAQLASKEFSFSFQDSNFNLDPVQSHKPSTTTSSNENDEEKEIEEEEETGLRHRRSSQQQNVPEILPADSNIESVPSSLISRKTKSRLIDPTPTNSEIQKKSGRLPPNSGLREDEDEDPFIDEDIPNALKRSKFSFVTFIQWMSLIVILGALLCTFGFNNLRGREFWGLQIWKWELLGFALICGRLISGWVIRIVVFFIERGFLLRKRVLYFVYSLRSPVQNSLWLSLVLLSWYLLYDKEHIRNLKPTFYITKVLLCMLVTSLFHLSKTLLVKIMALYFHVTTYFDRIQEALFHQYVIETLSGPPILEMKKAEDEEEQIIADMHKFQSLGYKIPNELSAASMDKSKVQKKKEESSTSTSPIPSPRSISIGQIYNLSKSNISAWNMKRLIRMIRYGTLTTLDDQIPSVGGGDESTTSQIRNEYEAKVAAKKIFINVAKPEAKNIYLSDLLRFMKQAEAVKTMSLFEGAQEHHRISKKSLKSWVVSAFRERKALALTLNDTKTAVNRLNHIINVIVGFIIFALCLLILELAKPSLFVFLGSQVLLAVFMFGNTLKTLFEAIIFLFVMHPFDVGDRCEVDGVQLVVEEMNIMSTVFLRDDNLKISYPNNVLATKFIGNFYRSPDMGDEINFCIHVATPVEKRVLMKERIINFIEDKKEHWYPNPQVVLRDVEDMNRLKVSIWMQHRMNFQDMGMRFERRESIMDEMIRILRELDIEYRMLPRDVNVKNMPSATISRFPSTWSTFV